MLEQLEKGDIAVCVYAAPLSGSKVTLTLGKEYLVEGTAMGHKLTRVLDDTNQLSLYARSRFAKVGPPVVIEVLY